jgi:phosphomevalonate kinase
MLYSQLAAATVSDAARAHAKSTVAAISDVDRIYARLIEIRQLFNAARGLLRQMGKGAGVEIEPSEQTELADATEAIPGVLCAGVPGAGGVDAIFALTLSTKARSRVEAMWSKRGGGGGAASDEAVCPLLLRAEGGLKAGVRAEFDLDWN